MMKKLLLFAVPYAALCVALLPAARAQAQTLVRSTLEWADEPERFRSENGYVLERWRFDGAIFDDSAPQLPVWIERFGIDGPGALRVEVVDAQFEPFDKKPGPEDERLGEELRFYALSSLSESGYRGKVSCVPIVMRDGRYLRATQISLRIYREPRTGVARGPLTENSVLSDGEVYRMAVSEDGVYKLTYSYLKNTLGIANLDNIDPRTIKIYGNGGGHLPEHIYAERPDDLVENHIFISGEADGRFDASDYIVFYAQGPHRWRYDADDERFIRQTNIYDTRNHYFLKVGSGQGLRAIERSSVSATAATDAFDWVQRYEKELINPLYAVGKTPGGQTWYGEFYKIGREQTFRSVFNFSGLITNEPAQLEAVMGLRATRTSSFQVVYNGQTFVSGVAASVPIDGSISEITNPVVNSAFLSASVNLTAEQVDLTLRYPFPSGAQVSEGWLDYLQMTARCALRWPGSGQLVFRDTRSTDNPATTFRLSDANDQVVVWDITNPLQPERQQATLSGGVLQFGAETTILREFIAFRPADNLPQPEAMGKMQPQNLHALAAAEMLIIYHPDFQASAERLAEHRRSFSDLDVKTIDINLVYPEFSSGKVDPTAIRDFVYMVYQRAPSLRYLLLVGDGSFDCRGIYPNLGKNFIPVYENNSSSEISGYAADDYYGIFDGNPNFNPLAFDLNISVGRLPVNTAADADAVVDKIINYDTQPENFRDWRTRLLFVGDDEDSATHSDDADLAANVARQRIPALNREKLYFDLFPQESTPAGDFFPSVAEGIDRAIFRGALAVTYLGHGGPRGWAQERVLTIPQLQQWSNLKQLPLFITATCTFAGYDDASFVSAGEEMFLAPRGGAIALLTTVRPVYASRNSALTNGSLEALFTRSADGSWPTLGSVIRQAKNNLSTPGAFDNERKFVLLGDPAMRLAIPDFNVSTLSINGNPVNSAAPDTIRALQQVTIEGQVTDLSGQLMSNFNGLVYPTVYDKAQTVRTLQQDPTSSARSYEVQRSVIFKGRARVTNGRFSFQFVAPKDIDYAFGAGRISYYAADSDQMIDAAGYTDELVIGGSAAGNLTDNEGPQVEVFINTADFVFGSIVDNDPVLLVKLSDDNGINVVGNSIGHDLEGVLNENVQNTFLLNDFYEADIDDYRKGEARYPLGALPSGRHKVKVRAWDVANNSAEGFTEFIIADDGKVALQHVLNYPNPFTDRTCFQFDHNLAGEDIQVLVQIYTISGRVVKTLEALLPANDGAIRLDDCIEWDGKDEYGDQLARGVYLYQVRVKTVGGSNRGGESDFSKLVILK